MLRSYLNLASVTLYYFNYVDDLPINSDVELNVVYGTKKISPDGKYFFSDYNSLGIYKQTNDISGFTKIGNIIPGWSSIKKYEFNTINSDECVIVIDSTFNVYQCEPFILKHSFSISSKERITSIDYFNNEILTYQKGILKIRKYPTGETLKTIPVNSDCNFVLYNHIIFFNNSGTYIYSANYQTP